MEIVVNLFSGFEWKHRFQLCLYVPEKFTKDEGNGSLFPFFGSSLNIPKMFKRSSNGTNLGFNRTPLAQVRSKDD